MARSFARALMATTRKIEVAVRVALPPEALPDAAFPAGPVRALARRIGPPPSYWGWIGPPLNSFL